VVVAVSIRIVGILLITSLLVIPAATSRQWVRSPETMAMLAAVFGIISVFGGIMASYQLDTPAGPSIVTTATLLFVVLFPLSAIVQKKRQIV